MTIDDLIATPVFRAAEDLLRSGYHRFVEDIVTLTEIPAPPFAETVRGEAVRGMMAAAGLADVRTDAVGNVLGLRPGRGGGLVAVAAHLDTVFPAGTDVTVRREGTRLYAPGVGDDTRGLAVLLTLARALNAAGVETERDILFVADVGEEGPGDLRGVRHLFGAGEFAGRIDAFFTFDGLTMEDLVTGAIGSRRFRIAFRGPGGHSFLDFGIVNPSFALGHFLSGLATVEASAGLRTTYSASVVGGGTSVNAIPQEIWVEIDLRSADPGEIERLDATMRALVAAAIARENGRDPRGGTPLTAEIVRIGDRPAAVERRSGPVVDEAFAALAAYGFAPRLSSSSTDANIPMSLGIPAVMFGSGPAAGGAHTLGEWIDVAPEAGHRALAAGLAAVLAVAGVDPAPRRPG